MLLSLKLHIRNISTFCESNKNQEIRKVNRKKDIAMPSQKKLQKVSGIRDEKGCDICDAVSANFSQLCKSFTFEF